MAVAVARQGGPNREGRFKDGSHVNVHPAPPGVRRLVGPLGFEPVAPVQASISTLLAHPGGEIAARPGARCVAPANRLRALSRDQPVTETTCPLSFLLAFTYALAYLLVTSARDRIDNSLLSPHQRYRFAGIPS